MLLRLIRREVRMSSVRLLRVRGGTSSPNGDMRARGRRMSELHLIRRALRRMRAGMKARMQRRATRRSKNHTLRPDTAARRISTSIRRHLRRHRRRRRTLHGMEGMRILRLRSTRSHSLDMNTRRDPNNSSSSSSNMRVRVLIRTTIRRRLPRADLDHRLIATPNPSPNPRTTPLLSPALRRIHGVPGMHMHRVIRHLELIPTHKPIPSRTSITTHMRSSINKRIRMENIISIRLVHMGKVRVRVRMRVRGLHPLRLRGMRPRPQLP